MTNPIQTTVTWLFNSATILWNFMINNSLLKYFLGLWLINIVYKALRKYVKG